MDERHARSRSVAQFVSVVDAGGFTRAGERVTHAVDRQPADQRLEENVGSPLLHRDGKRVTLTARGERLLSYARRILALAQEARSGRAARRRSLCGLASRRIRGLSAHRAVVGVRPLTTGLRLDVRCDLSVKLRAALERSELDLALIKRNRRR